MCIVFVCFFSVRTMCRTNFVHYNNFYFMLQFFFLLFNCCSYFSVLLFLSTFSAPNGQLVLILIILLDDSNTSQYFKRPEKKNQQFLYACELYFISLRSKVCTNQKRAYFVEQEKGHSFEKVKFQLRVLLLLLICVITFNFQIL